MKQRGKGVRDVVFEDGEGFVGWENEEEENDFKMQQTDDGRGKGDASRGRLLKNTGKSGSHPSRSLSPERNNNPNDIARSHRNLRKHVASFQSTLKHGAEGSHSFAAALGTVYLDRPLLAEPPSPEQLMPHKATRGPRSRSPTQIREARDKSSTRNMAGFNIKPVSVYTQAKTDSEETEIEVLKPKGGGEAAGWTWIHSQNPDNRERDSETQREVFSPDELKRLMFGHTGAASPRDALAHDVHKHHDSRQQHTSEFKRDTRDLPAPDLAIYLQGQEIGAHERETFLPHVESQAVQHQQVLNHVKGHGVPKHLTRADLEILALQQHVQSQDGAHRPERLSVDRDAEEQGRGRDFTAHFWGMFDPVYRHCHYMTKEAPLNSIHNSTFMHTGHTPHSKLRPDGRFLAQTKDHESAGLAGLDDEYPRRRRRRNRNAYYGPAQTARGRLEQVKMPSISSVLYASEGRSWNKATFAVRNEHRIKDTTGLTRLQQWSHGRGKAAASERPDIIDKIEHLKTHLEQQMELFRKEVPLPALLIPAVKSRTFRPVDALNKQEPAHIQGDSFGEERELPHLAAIEAKPNFASEGMPDSQQKGSGLHYDEEDREVGKVELGMGDREGVGETKKGDERERGVHPHKQARMRKGGWDCDTLVPVVYDSRSRKGMRPKMKNIAPAPKGVPSPGGGDSPREESKRDRLHVHDGKSKDVPSTDPAAQTYSSLTYLVEADDTMFFHDNNGAHSDLDSIAHTATQNSGHSGQDTHERRHSMPTPGGITILRAHASDATYESEASSSTRCEESPRAAHPSLAVNKRLSLRSEYSGIKSNPLDVCILEECKEARSSDASRRALHKEFRPKTKLMAQPSKGVPLHSFIS